MARALVAAAAAVVGCLLAVALVLVVSQSQDPTALFDVREQRLH